MKKLILLLSVCLISCSEKQPPNVVFILVDDLGWSDLGYSGSSFYESPNIDAFSKESVQFTNAYAAGSVCSPSRAAIMSGKHPVHVNITDWIPGSDPFDEKLIGPEDQFELALDEYTLAEAFRDGGYETFFAGKWHLGSIDYYPEDQGFDINIGGHEKGSPPGGYYAPYNNPKLVDGPEGEYLPDRLTDESIKFLHTDREQPFFLFLSYYTVHTPIQASRRHLPKFEEKLQSLNNPQNAQREEGRGITRLDQYNPEYASMVYAMDENVGKLINALKQKGLYDNTIIVFTSDNGGLSTLDSTRRRPAPTSVIPLRGGKGWLYEGGIRVPLLIKPAQANQSNQVVADAVIGHDLYPTTLSLAALHVPTNLKLDGLDLSPLIHQTGNLDREALFWHYPHYHGSGWTPGSAIRQGDWKLIQFYETETFELYNLADDLAESYNLAEEQPERLAKLQERLKALQETMNARNPWINVRYAKSSSITSPKPEDGVYTYHMAYDEWRGSPLGGTCLVEIKGDKVRIMHDGTGGSSKKKGDVLEEGILLKHEPTGHWIIGQSPADAQAPELGGCSDGPTIIDVVHRIYLSC